MKLTEAVLARLLYESERIADGYSFAKGHTFEEWLEYMRRLTPFKEQY